LGVAALSFILSALLVAKHERPENEEESVKPELSVFFKNKIILVLIITAAITIFVQTLGNSYYGIFIFNNFKNAGFGGYLNVAIIFTIALITSIVAPLITRKNSIEYGKFPMLVFGTLLMAIMPLSFYYKPNLISIAMGTILGVIGGAINGVAQGLLVLELINDVERKIYFNFVGLLAALPLIITVPAGAYIAQTLGLQTLFLILAILLGGVVVPLYFFIVILYHKKEKI
jgi:MFS family permease